MIKHNSRRGFTLVELTLVMAFMSVLLLAILYLTIHAGKLYTKGVTNKTLNQITRDITDLMKRDVLASDSKTINNPAPSEIGDQQTGRLCTGTVSYLWNTAALLDNTVAAKITYNGNPVTFVRVIDPGASLCLGDPAPTVIPDAMKVTELLSTNGRDFAIYSLTIVTIASDASGRGLYSVHMVLGTHEKDTTQVDADAGVQCKPPTDSSTNFDYCTVGEFTTILRAGGRGNL
ncbi:type II secretion system protein [Candidatus Saccharibacteria bacterium]|nr:MAG: type II secretion system protein [Candidatus Saccharibacteria bacterium]